MFDLGGSSSENIRDLNWSLKEGTGMEGTIETTALFADLVCRYRPDHAAASGAYQALSGSSGRWIFGVAQSLGPIDLYLAKLAHAAGKDHRPHLETAMKSIEAGGATFWVNQAQAFTETIDGG